MASNDTEPGHGASGRNTASVHRVSTATSNDSSRTEGPHRHRTLRLLKKKRRSAAADNLPELELTKTSSSLDTAHSMGSSSSVETARTQLTPVQPPQTDKPRKKSWKVIGKRAAKIAGDIAFGSATFEPSTESVEEAQKRIAKNRYIRLTSELRYKLRQVAFEEYLKQLQFFLKYMDDSELNDPINYAVTRRDLYLMWRTKSLNTLQQRIELYEKQIKLKPTVTSSKMEPTLSDCYNLPEVDKLRKDLFQDQRVILLVLWYRQVFKLIMDEKSVASQLIGPKSKDSADKAVCIVTCNKLGTPFQADSLREEIFSGNIAHSGIEFVHGWELRHEMEWIQTNVVTIWDEYSRLYDPKGLGYLPPEVLKGNPQFKTDVLSARLKEYPPGSRERHFFEMYASFTSPTAMLLPLRDQSQDYLICESLPNFVANQQELHSALKDMHRVIKPNGTIYIHAVDVDPLARFTQQQKEATISSASEWARYKMSQKLSLFINEKGGMLTDATKHIAEELKSCGFTNVRSSYVGYPVIETDESNNDDSVNMMLEVPSSATMEKATSSNLSSSQNSTNSLPKENGDTRMNAFFELLSSFTEMICVDKALDLSRLSRQLQVCEEIEAQDQPSNKLLASLPDIDRDQLDLIKLFVDYKKNGPEGKLVQEQLLNDAEFDITSKFLDNDTRYEGVAYMSVFVADRI